MSTCSPTPIKASLVDDFSALMAPPFNSCNNITSATYNINIFDDFSALVEYVPKPCSDFYDQNFIVNLIDDLGDTPDEWVLITESGLVISLEDKPNNYDEFAIIVT